MRIPAVEVDLQAVRRRARDVVETSPDEGAAPFEQVGIAVYLQEARLVGDHRVELADGTLTRGRARRARDGDRGDRAADPGLADGPYWTNREAIWEPERRAALARGDRHRGDRHRVRADLRAVRHRGHGRRDAAADPAERGRGGGRGRVVPAFEARGDPAARVDATIERADHDDGAWTLALAGGEALEVDAGAGGDGPPAGVRRRTTSPRPASSSTSAAIPCSRTTLRTTRRTSGRPATRRASCCSPTSGATRRSSWSTTSSACPVRATTGWCPGSRSATPRSRASGLTERAGAGAGHEVRTTVVQMERQRAVAHRRARPFGLVKLVADARTGELLGGHVVGEEAGAMIHEVVGGDGRPDPGVDRR